MLAVESITVTVFLLETNCWRKPLSTDLFPNGQPSAAGPPLRRCPIGSPATDTDARRVSRRHHTRTGPPDAPEELSPPSAERWPALGSNRSGVLWSVRPRCGNGAQARAVVLGSGMDPKRVLERQEIVSVGPAVMARSSCRNRATLRAAF